MELTPTPGDLIANADPSFEIRRIKIIKPDTPGITISAQKSIPELAKRLAEGEKVITKYRIGTYNPVGIPVK